MIIKSFIFSGTICLIAQVIKDNTKLTSGHITSLFCVIGATLSSLGVYDKLIDHFGAGANVVIMSFGNSLYNASIKYGILNMLYGGSIGLVSSIIIAGIVTIIFKSKN